MKEPQKKSYNEKEAVKAKLKVENEKLQTRGKKIVTEKFKTNLSKSVAPCINLIIHNKTKL